VPVFSRHCKTAARIQRAAVFLLLGTVVCDVGVSGNAVHLETADHTRDTTCHMDTRSIVVGAVVNAASDAYQSSQTGVSDRLVAANALKAGYDAQGDGLENALNNESRPPISTSPPTKLAGGPGDEIRLTGSLKGSVKQWQGHSVHSAAWKFGAQSLDQFFRWHHVSILARHVEQVHCV
jgi:hypothetical protein